MTKLVFLDTETTSLDPRTRQAWDVGYIIRDTETGKETSTQLFIKVDLHFADPISLNIGRYYERHPDPYGKDILLSELLRPDEAARHIARDLNGAIIVGAVPSFDVETLSHLLNDHGLRPTWHYHLVDVESLAAGALGMEPPWKFDILLEAWGVTQDPEGVHTAFGDAVCVRNLYDAVMANARALTKRIAAMTDEELDDVISTIAKLKPRKDL